MFSVRPRSPIRKISVLICHEDPLFVAAYPGILENVLKNVVYMA